MTSAELRLIAKSAADRGEDFADISSQEPSADLLPDRIGVHEQAEIGLFSIGILVLAGRLSLTQIKKIADLAERHGDGTIRLTPQHNLLFLNVPKEKVALILEGLAPVGLKAAASPMARGLMACAEKEFCRELIQYLERRIPLEEPIQLHVSDGSGRCAHPAAQIELMLDPSGGAGSIAVGSFILRQVARPEVKVRLEQLMVGYKKQRKAGERFDDFCRRIGNGRLQELLKGPETCESSLSAQESSD